MNLQNIGIEMMSKIRFSLDVRFCIFAESIVLTLMLYLVEDIYFRFCIDFYRPELALKVDTMNPICWIILIINTLIPLSGVFTPELLQRIKEIKISETLSILRFFRKVKVVKD